MAFLWRFPTFAVKRVAFKQFSRKYCSCSPPKKGLVLGVYECDKCITLSEKAEVFNKSNGGKLVEHLNYVGDVIKEGKSHLFWGLSHEFHAVAVVGLGYKNRKVDCLEQMDEKKESVRKAAAVGCHLLQKAGIKDIHVEPLGDPSAAAEGSVLSVFKYQEFKTKQEPLPFVSFYSGGDGCGKDEWDKGALKAEAQNIARRLMDTPSNHMTPKVFTENLKSLFCGASDVKIDIHDAEWAKEQKMEAFLAVAKGSVEPPYFVELTYNKAEGKPCYVLIGKGITFDSGGISIKPALNMDEMRADMGGAAVVLATLIAVAKLCIKINLKVLIPLCENLPSGSAVKPGDVVKAKNNKTICVDNTDAEGRLILADALSYSADFKPKLIVDVATLTGAMRVALGDAATGVFSNSDKFYDMLRDAGSESGDRVWRLPLWKLFTKQVTDFNAYDVNNAAKGKGAGSCLAAAFLKEFVPDCTEWMHLDIAGVMKGATEMPYLDKGMTGRPTRTLIEFVEKLAGSC